MRQQVNSGERFRRGNAEAGKAGRRGTQCKRTQRDRAMGGGGWLPGTAR